MELYLFNYYHVLEAYNKEVYRNVDNCWIYVRFYTPQNLNTLHNNTRSFLDRTIQINYIPPNRSVKVFKRQNDMPETGLVNKPV